MTSPAREDVEIWAEVAGSDGRYEVSTEGRIRSWFNGRFGWRSEPRILRASPNKHSGYPIVNLVLTSGKTVRSVHSLVAETFIGPRPDGMEVRHLNGIRSDARLDNLTYGTHKENIADKKLHGTELFGEDKPNAKLTYLKARAACTLYDSGEFSYDNIAEVFDVGSATIRRVISGQAWQATPERVTVQAV